MSDVILSRRRFLIGFATAAVATAIARPLQSAPLLKPVGDFSHRSSYSFDVLPDPTSTQPPHKQRIPVTVERDPDTRMMQIERGGFPTSYIPTDREIGYRDADRAFVSSFGEYDFTTAAGRQDPRLQISRGTPSFIVRSDGSIQRFEANKPRLTEHGLLIEPAAHNYLRHSDVEATPWSDQVVHLAPGRYILSWYGPGRVRISGPMVWILRSGADVKSVRHIPRQLTNAEIINLTE